MSVSGIPFVCRLVSHGVICVLMLCVCSDYGFLGGEEAIPVVGLREPLERKYVVDHLQRHGWWTPIRSQDVLLTGSHLTPLASVPGLMGRVNRRAAGNWSCASCRHSMVIPAEALPPSAAPSADPIRTYYVVFG